ncbi:YhgE/Pip family protein [Streptomyces sp. TR06-5]|uniref:YhgE/Pip family protein n=1 Tax=unclassified Streptomyces TaxID=2593676 RepID=UPI0039A10621
MRAPRLAALELRRFGRGRLPRAALAAVLLLPLLYGALYLWSFWDPYDRLDRVPVALVNRDRGATVEGERLDAGGDLVRGLRRSSTFDWQEVGKREARQGVADGRYFLSLTVPADFSERLASASGDDPATSALRVRTDDSNNYLVGQISRTVFAEVRAAASSKASRRFYDRIFVSFSTLHDRTQDAADGADRLKNGIGRAGKGASDLASGLEQASRGSGDLESGASTLHSGAGELEKGSKKVANGTRKLSRKVHRFADTAQPLLSEHEDEIAEAARTVAQTAGDLHDRLDDLPAAARRAKNDARRAADALAGLHSSLCEEPVLDLTGDGPGTAAGDCPQLKQARDAAERAADVAEDTDGLVREHRKLDDLGDRLDDLEHAANRIALAAPGLDDDLDRAVRSIDKLDAGAHKVADGAKKLHSGLGTAQQAASRLDDGLGQLSSGADSLDSGMYRLADGSRKLSSGLHDGADRIPDYDDAERDARTAVMADPVDLATTDLHDAPDYGTGFAPYFVPLSLWVGAMVAYMLLPPLNRRALAVGAPAWRVALAGWLPVAAIGAAQTAVLLSVLHWGLGLQMAHGAGTAAFLLLVTVCFTALVQFLGARFGPAGRILVLALLMLQLTSSGGTYPVQTSPDFFNALHPLLPMSYVVDGLRRLISGGGLQPVWEACGVLAVFTCAALALTAWTARRSQVWTVERLHPELGL